MILQLVVDTFKDPQIVEDCTDASAFISWTHGFVLRAVLCSEDAQYCEGLMIQGQAVTTDGIHHSTLIF